MLFRVFMLLILCAASAHGQDFVCGYEPDGDEVSGQSSHHAFRSSMATDPIKVLVLFGKFAGNSDPSDLRTYKFAGRDKMTPRLSTQLVDPTVAGSLAHYLEEMSDGKLHLASADIDAPTTWYEGTARPTLPTDCPVSDWARAVEDFSRAVLDNAYNDPNVDFTDVDLVALLTPHEMDNNCTVDGTFFRALNWRSSDGTTTINRVITSDWGSSFSFIVGVLSHEYGHAMGLPELYDRTNHDSTDVADRVHHSTGIGFWGVMGKGSNGYVTQKGVPDGPAPMSAWSRAEVGWLDSKVATVSSDMTVTIPDINSSSRKVIKIPVLGKTDEYFLLSNRQRGTTGSYYDDYAPRSGLLIWHIDDSIVRVNGSTSDINRNEKHKRVDVECADGLFTDRGFPGSAPDSTIGGDNLDFWSPDSTYRTDNNGNLGDATDVWTSGAFTPYSNPSTAGYNGNSQDVFTGIAVRNISQTNGVVEVDIRFIPLAPENLTATVSATVANQVDLSWSEPTSNGATITDYEYSDGRLGEDGNELWWELDWEKDNDTVTASLGT